MRNPFEAMLARTVEALASQGDHPETTDPLLEHPDLEEAKAEIVRRFGEKPQAGSVLVLALNLLRAKVHGYSAYATADNRLITGNRGMVRAAVLTDRTSIRRAKRAARRTGPAPRPERITSAESQLLREGRRELAREKARQLRVSNASKRKAVQS
jgi:hypothetical protein